MNKQSPLLEESQSQINSSTSSFSEIIPRQDHFTQVRKDKPIVMRSIPINKPKSTVILNANIVQSKKQSITMINSTHAYTSLSQSNISAEVYKNEGSNSRNFNSTKFIGNEQNLEQKQIIFNQKLVKSTYEQYQQRSQSSDNIVQINSKKQEPSSRQEIENIALDFSMSSMNSQKHHTISPKQPFKMYLDPSPQKSQPENKQQVKQYLDAIKEMRRQEQSRGTPIKSQSYQLQTLIKKNHDLETRIRQFQNLIKSETQSIIMERKANQIYTEFYHTLSKMISKFIAFNKEQFSFSNHDSSEPLNESLNMEKILQTIDKLIETFPVKQSPKMNLSAKSVQTQLYKFEPPKQQLFKPNEYAAKISQLQLLLETAQLKNAQLRNELLQSTQNNINAIFNTEISASCCLENQVTKINSEMTFLKQKMNLLISKSQPSFIQQQPVPPQIIYISQPSAPVNPFNERKENHIVNFYTKKSKMRESDDESDSIEENEGRKRRHSLSRKKKRSSRSQRQKSESSMSSKSTKKREEMSLKQIQNLKQAYNQTKNELNSLIQTFSLITSSQTEMKGYFAQVKDEIIRSMNEKMKQNQEEQLGKQKLQQSRIRQLEARNQIQRQMNKQQQAKISIQIAQKMKIKQESYINHIEFIKNERQEDRKVIENLNQKVIELLNAIAVPEKVNQEHSKQKCEIFHDDDIPLSQISVSVDYLKCIEQLKTQKQKQIAQIQALNKQNHFLKDEIIQLQNIYQRSRLAKNTNHSPSSSNEDKESIINELQGFTEMSLPPPLMINTGENYHVNDAKSNKTLKSNKHVTFNHLENSIAGRCMPVVQRIESEKLVKVYTASQRNLQNNLKAIVQSKQTHIRSLQKAIANLEQTIGYLKGQIINKQNAIDELENYVTNLENRSLNSISLSSPANNLPEPNLYTDSANSQEQIKQKYENYVKNLKLLLKQTRNENKILKQQLQNFEVQVDQQTQSNFNLKNSATHSQRTTKNFPNSVHIQHKNSAEIVIRKRTDNTQKYQNERQEQRINSLAFQNELPQNIDHLKTKGNFPSFE